MTNVELKIWKKIVLGQGESTKSTWLDGTIPNNAEDSLWVKTQIELVKLSVEELGFPLGAPYHHICRRAYEVGLYLCRAEVGPRLRCEYAEQPKKERLYVAMHPWFSHYTKNLGEGYIWYLENDYRGELQCRGYPVGYLPDAWWWEFAAEDLFVFERGRVC